MSTVTQKAVSDDESTTDVSRILWLTDGPHIATEPTKSMTSRAMRRATPDEVMEWRIRP
jgi:hypothetical protein